MRKTIFVTSLFFFILITCITNLSCTKNNQTPTPPMSGCASSDTAVLYTHDSCVYFIPNAFTPDADGINDLFMPLSYNLSNYSFKVMDGTSTLYITTVPNTGWNGMFNNNLMPAGHYTAEVKGTLACGTTVNKRTCFYLATYNSSNCIPKPKTTPLVFNDQVDPVTITLLFPTAETICP